jgi:hypothetical protein
MVLTLRTLRVVLQDSYSPICEYSRIWLSGNGLSGFCSKRYTVFVSIQVTMVSIQVTMVREGILL